MKKHIIVICLVVFLIVLGFGLNGGLTTESKALPLSGDIEEKGYAPLGDEKGGGGNGDPKFIIRDGSANDIFWINDSGYTNITDFLEVVKNITLYEKQSWLCFNVDCSSYIRNNGTHGIWK